MCRSPKLHSRDRERVHLHGMKEVLEAPDVNKSFQIVFCLSPELGLLWYRREAIEKHYQQHACIYFSQSAMLFLLINIPNVKRISILSTQVTSSFE